MRYYIINLGCKVNAYESKVMSDLLDNAGYLKGSIDDADIYIVNTCFVTNVAEHKSFQMIRKAVRNKKKLVVVCGCLPQIKYKEVSAIDGVDIVIGNKDKSKILEYINNYKEKIEKIYDLSNVEFEDMRLNNFDKTRAFVKIQDGCNNFCSYCIIPYTRGNVRNKKKEVVLDEVNTLVLNGHKEIVLTGIHTGNYNDEGYDLACLLNDLVKINGLKRIRISSIEITELNSNVLEVFKNSKVLVDHIHIPLQSGSNKILELMNRRYDKTYFINKINEIRSIRPSISITTDVIVGFPNETDELFLETIDTIRKVNFSKLHVFPYSKREGTPAASMENQIDEVIKKERVHKLLEISKELELDYFNKFLNETVEFIPEVYKDGYLIGHTGNYLQIKVKGDESLINELVNVKIESIEYPYCMSKICKEEELELTKVCN
ncbi:MAG: tRNA (N(6)-L-threonylcarbamoyladenosine(37)-C(2))-methylthiotransferase MtaB [Bacilli bacterium]|nr:tRNA (N(6)-L-threonylcarbamoyladenosine(37)-C(2))-methylthiotransferase MtaB [Bacilli bacterium]